MAELKMSNFSKRLILTIFSIPAVFFTFFWPQDTHILLIILFGVLITFLGSYEFGTLIFKKGINVRRFFLPVINSLIYLFAFIYANNFFQIQQFKQIWVLFGFFVISILSYIYARDVLKKDLSRSFEKMAYTILGIFYIGLPSFFVPFILNIDLNPENPVPIFYNINSGGTLTGSLMGLLLLVNVFSSDIFSYVFGMTMGKNNVIKLEASPNKSWAGYIGGYLTTFAWNFIFYIIIDFYFGLIKLPIWFYGIVPLFSGILIPIGDLVESVIKRSAQVKDSGTLVLGRGGVLDTVDTVLYYIPIYFIFLQMFFAFNSGI